MHCYEYPHPAVSVDIVVFTIRDGELKLLLIRRAGEPYRGKWALPGGFIEMDEELEHSARRELEEETGVSELYLEQLYTFGKPGRDPRERVITIAYYALIPSDKLQLRAASDADAAEWFSVGGLPELAFDHDEIVDMSRQRLMDKLDYSTIAFQLLGEEFTLSELQTVYETLLQEPVDKRNFRKWVLGLGVIEESGSEHRAGAHRPARLYRVIQPGSVIIIR